ncbi:MAG: RDD family protein [Candidatus Limnocylindrales bacterium]
MTDPSAPGRAGIQLPPGLGLAGVGVRAGAWLIDTLILGVLHAGFWILVVVAGVVTIDPEAQRQMEASPLMLPTVAPYRVNLTQLAAMMTVFVILNVLYATFFWWKLRGMPGQRLLALQVGSAATGRNLSFGRAVIRAVTAVGIPMATVAGLLFAVFALEASVPWQDLLDAKPGGPAEAWLSKWSLPLDLALLGAVAWPGLLLASMAASPRRQGLHDRLAGSLVVGKTRAIPPTPYGYYPGYGSAYGSPGTILPGTVPPGVVPPGAWPPGVVAPGSPPADLDAPAAESADGEVVPTDGSSAPGGISPWLAPPGRSDARPALLVATVNRRLAAYLFDCALVYMVYLMTASTAVAALLPSSGTTLDERTFILLGLAGGLEQMLYFVSGWTLRRGTLGQRFFHLRVADAVTGKALGPMDALVRWAVLQGPFALVSIAPGGMRDLTILVASGWMLYLYYTTMVDPDQRGLHDRFLNTRVSQED